jgi:transcriptional regulator with PAS, ATPase and Fis domain
MKIGQLMRNTCRSGASEHAVSEDLDLFHWDRAVPEAGVTYEVVDQTGAKVGEISGDRLLYLLESARTLDLTHIVNAIEDGVVVIDADGRICFENDAYCKSSACPCEKTVGRNMRVIEPDALLLKVLEQGVPIERKHHVVKSVGKNVSMRMYPIFRNGVIAGAFSLFRDVTELHALGQEVKRITGVAEEFISQIHVKNELERLQVVSRDPDTEI